MQAGNTSRGYGWVSRLFHWLVAALIFLALGYGLYSSSLPFETQDELLRVFASYSIHKTLGISVLLLALGRLAWLAFQGKPRPLHPERRLENFMAETVHWGLWVGMVVMPFSGWLLHASAPGGYSRILWPFGQRIAGIPQDLALSEGFASFHRLGWLLLAALILLHLAGALKHAVIDRDSTIARMAGRHEGLPEPPAGGHPAHAVLAALCGIGIWLAVILAAPSLAPAGSEQSDMPGLTQPAEADLTGVPSAHGWQVEDGRLEISVSQAGSPIGGQFANWQAAIDYDPESGAGGVEVLIDTASLTLGGVSDSAKGPEFLNAGSFPQASFAARIIPPQAEGAPHLAQGDLTIAGETVPATLPFMLEIDGDQARARGEMQVDRRDFQIGRTYTDESTVGFVVGIHFDLTARRP